MPEIKLVAFESSSGIALVELGAELHVLLPPYDSIPASIVSDVSDREAISRAFPSLEEPLNFGSFDTLIEYLRATIRLSMALDSRTFEAAAISKMTVENLDPPELDEVILHLLDTNSFGDLALLINAIGEFATNQMKAELSQTLRSAVLYIVEFTTAAIASSEPAAVSEQWAPPQPFFAK